jgi:hypothetical protein
MGSTVLEVVLGAIIAIVITIWVESLRKPRLSLGIIPYKDVSYSNRPASSARFLYLELKNEPLPRLFRWMSRNPALQCHGTITFHHLDGQNIFGRAMPIRWSGSPEPVGMPIKIEDIQLLIFDPSRYTLTPRMDVYPGESETLDVAARFDEEEECYGWSNENYFSDPIWRNPDWRLPGGRYLVKVVVETAGEKITGIYRLIGDVRRQDFRLEPKMADDVVPD